jgi:multidrug efflux pump subunit AcrA (membrane-fusion protein)
MLKSGRIAIVTLMTFIALGFYLESGAFAQQSDPTFKTAKVLSNQVGGNATVGGTVIPYKQVTLNAQIAGRIKFIVGKEGHRASKNDVLLTIDDAAIQAKRRAASALIYRAQSSVQNAQMQYSRELYAPRINSISGFPGMGVPTMFDQFFTRGFSDSFGRSNSGLERRADLYARGSGVSQAEGGLMQARANLEALDAQLRDAKSVAPFDGVVVAKMVEVGDTVQPGMPLLKYAYTDYLRIVADVPVRLAAGLQKGMTVPARLDAGGGGSVAARVAQIYPVADPARHTVKVKFDLPKGTRGGPGMYVEVTIPDHSIPTRNQPSVPATAVVWRGSLPSVFVLEGGRPSLRLIRVGYPLPGGRISVVSGLSGGEDVIIDPPASLVSGN